MSRNVIGRILHAGTAFKVGFEQVAARSHATYEHTDNDAGWNGVGIVNRKSDQGSQEYRLGDYAAQGFVWADGSESLFPRKERSDVVRDYVTERNEYEKVKEFGWK